MDRDDTGGAVTSGGSGPAAGPTCASSLAGRLLDLEGAMRLVRWSTRWLRELNHSLVTLFVQVVLLYLTISHLARLGAAIVGAASDT
jgi:hypothetical protein